MAKKGAVSSASSEAMNSVRTPIFDVPLKSLEHKNKGAEALFKSIYSSKLRLNILSSLYKGKMSLADLGRAVNASAPNVASKAKELEYMHLVERNDGCYMLTHFGKAIYDKVSKLDNFSEAFAKHSDWWTSHYTDAIPKNFFHRLDELSDSVIIKGTTTKPNAVFDSIVNIVMEARELRTVVCICGKVLLDPLYEIIKNGVKVHIVKNVGNLDYKTLQDHVRYSKKMMKHENFESMYNEKIQLACCYNQEAMMLGLFNSNEPREFDYNAWLFSKSPAALQWADDLFNYFKKDATPVKEEDLDKLLEKRNG